MPTPFSAELENSRLGVIYFLGNLQVDLSPEKSVTDLKNAALGFAQGKLGAKGTAVANKAGGVVEAIEKKIDDIGSRSARGSSIASTSPRTTRGSRRSTSGTTCRRSSTAFRTN
jgi:hypothetical protein